MDTSLTFVQLVDLLDPLYSELLLLPRDEAHDVDRQKIHAKIERILSSNGWTQEKYEDVLYQHI